MSDDYEYNHSVENYVQKAHQDAISKAKVKPRARTPRERFITLLKLQEWILRQTTSKNLKELQEQKIL